MDNVKDLLEYKESRLLEKISDVQSEIILNQREKIKELEEKVIHLETLLMSVDILNIK